MSSHIVGDMCGSNVVPHISTNSSSVGSVRGVATACVVPSGLHVLMSGYLWTLLYTEGWG